MESASALKGRPAHLPLGAQGLAVQRLCGLVTAAFEIIICADVGRTSTAQPGVALWLNVGGPENEPQSLKSTKPALPAYLGCAWGAVGPVTRRVPHKSRSMPVNALVTTPRLW